MFNLYEAEKLGEIRRAQLRNAAKQARDFEAAYDHKPSIMGQLLMISGDTLITLGHRLKSLYAVEGVVVRRYGMDV